MRIDIDDATMLHFPDVALKHTYRRIMQLVTTTSWSGGRNFATRHEDASSVAVGDLDDPKILDSITFHFIRPLHTTLPNWHSDDHGIMVRLPLPYSNTSDTNCSCRSVIKDRIVSPGFWYQQRVDVSWYNFDTVFMPVVLGYYVMAVLVQLPRTKLYRLAFLPVMLWLALRAGMSLDFSWGRSEYAYLNQGLAVSLAFIPYILVHVWT